MFKKLLPKEDRFFSLFREHANTIAEGIDLFESLLTNYSEREELTIRIKEAEHRADQIAHEIFGLLNTVFVTPFDREDIQSFANHMDDIIDLVEKAGNRMNIYDMPSLPDHVREVTDILKKAFSELLTAVGMLSDLKRKDEILKICINVNSLENEGDVVLRRALRDLFDNPVDPFSLIKQKEIYELLESAIDRCEDLAHVIETILVKYA
ncbi:MAG: DUF47 domain-containing protein [Desulfobacteraceae bacterium]|nr:DUF47 domain-containing protein [Desulfobacteraceae bacterium]